MLETVLLVEPGGDDGIPQVRPVQIRRDRGTINTIITEMTLSPTHKATQCFINKDGERDLSGRLRVFREVKDPPPAQRAEAPLFDEGRVVFSDDITRPTIR